MQDLISALVSNQADVREAFGRILWVLIPTDQTRLLAICAGMLFVPLGRPTLSVTITFVCFYCVASPITYVLSLTDQVLHQLLFLISLTTAGRSPNHHAMSE
jgi:Na+-driven multidrug efflux pump